MTYDEIAAIFLAPPNEPIAGPDLPDTPARRLRDALEPIATQGWWSPSAGHRLDALGLDFFAGYVWGRAAALGDPPAALVVATFGVFEPALLTAVYEAGRAAAPRDVVLAARANGAAESLAAVITESEADALAGPLLAALDGCTRLGRPLFAALGALPLPDNGWGRLWRAAELVREHRGDGHLAVLASSGVGPAPANVLTELWLGYPLGGYSASRGFAAVQDAVVADLTARGLVDADGTTLTDTGIGARSAIESLTDTSQRELVAALGSGLDDLVAGAAEVSAMLVDSGAFPPDPRKRAAG